MKETILSNCEQNFINAAAEEGTRLDGRDLLEARNVEIYFGSNWGSCVVSLGQTRAVAQVTCDIQQPKASRPHEGMIHINVELNPLAAQHFESGRQSEAAVLINRQLEKCFKDSKCIDLESLCIIADKMVWNVRLDINILNHDGNLVDCASIAALAALLHFHRPDITITGTDVIIHPFSEKDPLPLTLFFLPICVSFTRFKCGTIIMDPTYLEERIGIAQLTLGINSYKELCSLQFDYLTKTSTVEDTISASSTHAAKYAVELIQKIKHAVALDRTARYSNTGRYNGQFKNSIENKKLTTIRKENISIKLRNWSLNQKIKCENPSKENNECSRIVKRNQGFVELITDQGQVLGEGGQNTWYPSESSEEEAYNEEVIEIKPEKAKSKKMDNYMKKIRKSNESEDSEEETTEIVYMKDIL